MLIVVVFDRCSNFAVILEVLKEKYLVATDHHRVLRTMDLIAELDQLHVGIA